MPEEIADVKKQIQTVADTLGKTLDCGKSCDCRIRRSAGDRSGAEKKDCGCKNRNCKETRRLVFTMRTICSCCGRRSRDGAVLSPLQDESLPEGIAVTDLRRRISGTACKSAVENIPMRKAVHDAVADGLPTIAECGGFPICMRRSVTMREQSIRWRSDSSVGYKYRETGALRLCGCLRKRRRTSSRRAHRLRGMSFTIMTARTTAWVRSKKPVNGRSWRRS